MDIENGKKLDLVVDPKLGSSVGLARIRVQRVFAAIQENLPYHSGAWNFIGTVARDFAKGEAAKISFRALRER